MCTGKRAAGSKGDAGRKNSLRPQKLDSYHSTHNVYNRIVTTHLMKVRAIDIIAMDNRFGFCKSVKTGQRPLPDPRRQARCRNHVHYICIASHRCRIIDCYVYRGCSNASTHDLAGREFPSRKRQFLQLTLYLLDIHARIHQSSQKHVSRYPRKAMQPKHLFRSSGSL